MTTLHANLDATETPLATTEAYQELSAHVGRKSPELPTDLLVRHVLDLVPADEWPTRIAAMDAILRRLESSRREGLRVVDKPEKGRMLGLYTTKRKGASVRPYRTLLKGIDPIVARCDCPDFVKNGLGVCKHALAVLGVVHAKPRRLQLALREQDAARAEPDAGLFWDPIRPLTGLGDWLDRVSWHGPTELKGAKADARSEALKRFRKTAEPGVLTLPKTYADAPSKRLELIEALRLLLPKGKQATSDPALEAMLASESERLKRVVERGLSPAETRSALKGLKRTLYPYQREGIERFLATGRLLLADDMGLGKTAQAIACCDTLHRTGRADRVLIIAPAALKPQWAREWSTFSSLPVSIIDGTPAERQAIYRDASKGIFIINYEQLLRDLEIVKKWSPDLVVLDEAQRIKNWATKTALTVKGLSPNYRLVLTGTPMENRVEELASVVEWVDDSAMEPKWRLPAFHAIRADGRKEVVGVRHLDTLRTRLQPAMLRRIRREVLDQLPPRTDTRVPIELTEPQREEHDALNQPISRLIQISIHRPLTQAEFLRLMSLLTAQRIISNGLAQLRYEEVWPAIRGCVPEESMIQALSAPKLLELRQLVRQIVLEQGRKIVIFSQWRRMLGLAHWAVSDLLGGEGLRAGAFTGAEGRKRRTQNVVEFHDDPAFRILFASDAGGVGLNLQHAANCVINLELPWNPAVLEQRIGRIYRLGQPLPIDVYNLVCEEGIESRIADLVGSKQAFFKGLFDGDSDSVQFDRSSSFLSQVREIYAEEVPTAGAPDDGATGLEEILAIDDEEETDDHIDDEATDPYEPVMEAADESRDHDEPSAPIPVEVAPQPEPRRAAAGGRAPAMPDAHEVRRLFTQLRVRRSESGGVLIEAPPEAATTLGALFEGMAALLQAAADPE